MLEISARTVFLFLFLTLTLLENVNSDKGINTLDKKGKKNISTHSSSQSMPYPTQEEFVKRYSSRNKTSIRNRNNNQTPPYDGTVFIDENMIVDSDPSSSSGDFNFIGKKCRTLWDGGWKQYPDTQVFEVFFSDGVRTEIWVAPTINRGKAKRMVRETAFYLGQVPQFLRRGMRVVMIAKGNDGFGGNLDGHINFYDKSFDEFKEDGFITEVLIHEGAHSTLDINYYGWGRWERAVRRDGGFISNYAEDYPEREDVAETVSAWLGRKLKLFKKKDRSKIKEQIPNRLEVFNEQKYNLFPLDGSTAKPIEDYEYEPLTTFYFCDSADRSINGNSFNSDRYGEFVGVKTQINFMAEERALNATNTF